MDGQVAKVGLLRAARRRAGWLSVANPAGNARTVSNLSRGFFTRFSTTFRGRCSSSASGIFPRLWKIWSIRAHPSWCSHALLFQGFWNATARTFRC